MRASAKLLPWPPSQTLTLTLSLILTLTLTLTLTLILTLALALILTLALTPARTLTLTPTLTWSAAAGASGAGGGSAAPPPSQAFLAGAAAGAASGSPPTEGAREARLEEAYGAEARLEAYFEMAPPARVRVRGRLRVRVRARISPHAPLALISPRLARMVAFPLPPLVLTRGARGGLAHDGLDAQPHHLAARVELDLLGRVRVRR